MRSLTDRSRQPLSSRDIRPVSGVSLPHEHAALLGRGRCGRARQYAVVVATWVGAVASLGVVGACGHASPTVTPGKAASGAVSAQPATSGTSDVGSSTGVPHGVVIADCSEPVDATPSITVWIWDPAMKGPANKLATFASETFRASSPCGDSLRYLSDASVRHLFDQTFSRIAMNVPGNGEGTHVGFMNRSGQLTDVSAWIAGPAASTFGAVAPAHTCPAFDVQTNNLAFLDNTPTTNGPTGLVVEVDGTTHKSVPVDQGGAGCPVSVFDRRAVGNFTLVPNPTTGRGTGINVDYWVDAHHYLFLDGMQHTVVLGDDRSASIADAHQEVPTVASPSVMHILLSPDKQSFLLVASTSGGASAVYRQPVTFTGTPPQPQLLGLVDDIVPGTSDTKFLDWVT